MALIGLGVENLSMPASGVGAVKRMVRSLDRGSVSRVLEELQSDPDLPVRKTLLNYAHTAGVML